MTRGRAKDLFDLFVAQGEAQIDKMIAQQIAEELFIDYKRSADDGRGLGLNQSDRVNYARAISGFGNSEGGVIVWGVECRRDRGDLPDKKFPLTDPKRFISALEGTTSGCTLPPHDGVLHHAIELPNSNDGFAVSYIPKSLKAPHQCITNGKSHERYLIRAGSDFLPAPHGLLAGMFGRRPTPTIYAGWIVDGEMAPADYAPFVNDRPTSVPHLVVGLMIKNDGLVVTKDLFANYWSNADSIGLDMRFDESGHKFEVHQSLTRWNMISVPDFRLAPSSEIVVFRFSVYVKGHVTAPFEYEFVFGCSESQVHTVGAFVPTDAVNAAYDEFMSSDKGKPAARRLSRKVFDSDRVGKEYAASIGY